MISCSNGRKHQPLSEPRHYQPCVDAPSDAREIFGLIQRVVRAAMCAACDAAHRRGPGWESADPVQIRTTCSRLLSQSWFS
jgi:hypothetical protein